MSYKRKVEPILVKSISSNNTKTTAPFGKVEPILVKSVSSNNTETTVPVVSSDIVTNIIIGTASVAVLVGVIFIIIFSAGI